MSRRWFAFGSWARMRNADLLADFSQAGAVLLVPPLVLLGFLLRLSELLLASLQPVGHGFQLPEPTQQLLPHLLFLHLQTQLHLPHLCLLHLQLHAVLLRLQPNLLDLQRRLFLSTTHVKLWRVWSVWYCLIFVLSLNVVLTDFLCFLCWCHSFEHHLVD